MNTRTKFKQKIIELIHGLPYEEAVEKEKFDKGKGFIDSETGDWTESWICWSNGFPITIGRVMQALNNCKTSISYRPFYQHEIQIEYSGKLIATWKLLKEDKSTADDDYQTDECISKIYELIK